MYLYFDYSPLGALRWYVKVSRKGRRIGIREEYGTKAFDAAYDAAVTALGGIMRKRRSAPDPLVQPERRYVQADRSQRGQTRYYVQLRNGLPKIRIRAEPGTKDFDEECDAAIASQIALYGDASDYINAQKQRNEPRGELTSEPPTPIRCAGIGHSTNRATTGWAISASAKKGFRNRPGYNAPD
jgi:hypothetical protein